MISHLPESPIPATMTLTRQVDGSFTGEWSSRGAGVPLKNIVLTGDAIEFDRELPGGGTRIHFSGTRTGDKIEGKWSGSFGEIPVEGHLLVEGEVGASVEAAGTIEGNYHKRPIVEENGRTLLWANASEWFDLTNATIDPHRFQHGIGKDTIPSIDKPVFVRSDDARATEAGITLDTPVLGVVIDGEARAYPVSVMSMHEIVNDDFGGSAFAVMW